MHAGIYDQLTLGILLASSSCQFVSSENTAVIEWNKMANNLTQIHIFTVTNVFYFVQPNVIYLGADKVAYAVEHYLKQRCTFHIGND